VNVFRSYLKKVFWPKLFVGRSAQILEIPEYSSGLILAAAAILAQNPFFEMASGISYLVFRADAVENHMPHTRH
jgi:hypothetical protein